MAMRYEDSIEAPKPDSRPQDLALGALATVNQDAIVAEADNMGT